jgi:GTP pyrophosphokinase
MLTRNYFTGTMAFSMNDLERAIEIATTAHAGQTDKGGATYIRHPLRVMAAMGSETARVVAVLHDVVEDGDQTLDELERAFDAEIREAVDALTKRPEETDNYMRFVRRAAEHPIAQRVKIADIEDNMDLTRLDDVNGAVIDNQAKYHRAWTYLQRVDT